jgi:putative transposase
LRRQTFETAIIERYRRRENSVEEALIEMYLAGISVRRVEDITAALWGWPNRCSNINLGNFICESTLFCEQKVKSTK